MPKFARLFDIENEQILFTLDYNDQEDNYELAIRTEYLGLTTTMTLGGCENEERGVKMLEEVTQEKAVNIFNGLKQVLEGEK